MERREGDIPGNHSEIERRLWEIADELRANSKLKSSEYSVPVLGLIFLRYADSKFAQAMRELPSHGTGRRVIGKVDYQARGVMYLLLPKLISGEIEVANIEGPLSDDAGSIENVL